MRNKNLVFKRLEQIDIKMTQLKFLIKNKGTVGQILETIENTREIVQTITDMVEQEPTPQNEINRKK